MFDTCFISMVSMLCLNKLITRRENVEEVNEEVNGKKRKLHDYLSEDCQIERASKSSRYIYYERKILS